MTQPNDDNWGPWIEHDGGPCPILNFEDWTVEVKFRDGKNLPCKAAGVWDNFEGHPYADIIAYRVRQQDDMLARAIEALRLFDAYMSTPTDRGGSKGPKGQAYLKFIDAKTAIIAEYDKRIK